MNRMYIAKRLTKNLLLTFFISSILTFFAIQIYFSKDAGSLEGSQGIFITTLGSIFWILVLAASSLTIFLNLYDKIRLNKLYSALTFYLLPVLVAAIFFIKSGIEKEWDSFFVITILYFFTQTYFFVKFTKANNETVVVRQKN
ncbi:MAG: hypothetical protein ABJB11_23510 [Ferruginibacter sp.]